MSANQLIGKTVLWTFTDGALANKSFLHMFSKDGTVTFQSVKLGGAGQDDVAGAASEPVEYEIAPVGQSVCALSYLVDSGYTLTVILDFDSGELVAFSSNEKRLTMQHGTFEIRTAAKRGHSAHAPH